MMEWIDTALNWAKSHDVELKWLSAASLAFFLLTPIVVGWLVTRMPTDYFRRRRRRALGSWEQYPLLRLVALVAKSALGFVLVIAGLLMLVTPGQGMLTIVVGLILLEFPGKRRLQRWLIMRRHVWRSINWLRKRAGRPELESPR